MQSIRNVFARNGSGKKLCNFFLGRFTLRYLYILHALYHVSPRTCTFGLARCDDIGKRSKSVSHSFRPEWNDVNIVRALIFIAKAALDDPRTTHVLFATESCIPITSLCYAASVITASKDCTNRQCNHGERLNMGKSFISAYNGRSERCTRFDERT